MRLGQVSRKYAVRPAEIVALLRDKGIAIEESANAKIGEDAMRIIIDRFAPGAESSMVNESTANAQESTSNDQQVEEAIGETELSEATAMDEMIVAEELPESTNNGTDENLNEINGVIKPVRVELKGLKVVGKIELPEPRKKEAVNESSQEENTSVVNSETPVEKGIRSGEKRAERGRGTSRSKRPAKNPIALERERLAREAAERKKLEEERERERRKQHYHKRVKPKGPTKAVKIYEEHETLDPEPQEKPTTLWGKIVHWLTSY